MNATLARGLIVLADLSGFARFVTETEIRHGAEVVAALLDTVRAAHAERAGASTTSISSSSCITASSRRSELAGGKSRLGQPSSWLTGC